MNVHLYNDPDPYITADWSSWCKVYGCGGVISPSVVDIMAQNGDAAKPIVSTEGGINVSGSTTESSQASIVSHYLADSRPVQAYVYNMLDEGDGYGLEVQDPNGTIIDPTGTHWRRRPAFSSAQTAMGGTG
jgi:hypothetical protein